MEVFPGISMDAKIRFGKPCLVGTRIDVATVLSELASGSSVEQLASEYQLTAQQISTALRYAAYKTALISVPSKY
jgi:uncharacterized protein (DUF433 family)